MIAAIEDYREAHGRLTDSRDQTMDVIDDYLRAFPPDKEAMILNNCITVRALPTTIVRYLARPIADKTMSS